MFSRLRSMILQPRLPRLTPSSRFLNSFSSKMMPVTSLLSTIKPTMQNNSPQFRYYTQANNLFNHSLEMKKAAENRLAAFELIPPDKKTERFDQRLKSVKVFYSTQKYPQHNLAGDHAFTLERALKKIVPVDVGASHHGEVLSGRHWPGSDYFMKLKPGDAKGLSPEERVLARNKIIASEAMIYSYGGYPSYNPVKKLSQPKHAYVFTLAGMQFESPHLDYKLCIIDTFNNNELYKQISSNFNKRYLYLKSDNQKYINRGQATGKFTLSNDITNQTVIFDRDTYFNSVKNDFVMMFAAADHIVDPSKPIYFKAPFVGLGFFSCVNRMDFIKSVLTPIYLDALTSALKNYQFKNLKIIEVPVFSDVITQKVKAFSNGKDLEINGVKIIFKHKTDVLNFDSVSDKEYNLCILNPGDAHSYPGNEFGASKTQPSSVESAIGNHTDIRYVQNFLLNPQVLSQKNWVGITIADKHYEYQNADQAIQHFKNK